MSNTLLNQVNKSVKNERVQDQTEDKGGFEREIIPEGVYPARFVGWVEVGDRDGGEWKGKKKPPVRKAYAFYELLNKKLAQEIEIDGETKTIYPVHREMIDVKQGEKANLTKLFKKMAAGRDMTHIAQMLGEAFRVKIVHVHKGEGANKKTYENARTKDDGWLVMPPTFEKIDEETGESETKVLKVMEPTVPLKLLLWDDPTVEQWESIKGRPFTPRGEGQEEFAGGFLQFACIHEALDFEGSPLETLLSAGELPDMGGEDPDEPVDDGDDEDEAAGDEKVDSGDDDLGLDDLNDEIPF